MSKILLKHRTVAWLAWKEFSIFFTCNKCSNRWDFPRFILLLAFSMLLSLFAIGTKHGLLENFSAVLLGEIPNEGIPMWLSPNIGAKNLKQKGLDQLLEQGYKFHPFLLVQAAHLRLPRCLINENTDVKSSQACNLWKETNSSKVPFFKGLAVFSDDPLWKFANVRSKGTKFEIVLNKSLFKKYFNYDLYYQLMSKILPNEFAQKLTSKNIFFSSKDQRIWLSYGKGDRLRQLMPFNIHWVEYIPVSGEVAFLFPLNIYHTLELSKKKNLMLDRNYFPESSENIRIDSINIALSELGQHSDEKLIKIEKCLQRINTKTCSLNSEKEKCQENRYNVDNRITKVEDLIDIKLIPLKPILWVKACIQEIGMQACNDEIRDSCIGIIASDKPFIKIQFGKSNYNFSVSDSYNETKKYYSLFDFIGYDKGFVYLPNASELINSKDTIENMKGKPFYFNQRYDDSLTRFNALNDILQSLSETYGVWIILFIILLLGVQLAVMINNKKHEFMVYTWKGIELKFIFFLIFLQIVASSIMAFVISCILIFATIWVISDKMFDVSDKYTNIFFGETINMFTILLSDYFLVYIGILTICVSWLFVLLGLFSKDIHFRS